MSDEVSRILFPHYKYSILVGKREECEITRKEMGIATNASKIVSPRDIERLTCGMDGSQCVMLLCYGWKENLDNINRIMYVARQRNIPVLEVIR